MKKIFPLILIVFFYQSDLIASNGEKIINKLNKIENLSFNFIQTINGKDEKGECIIEFEDPNFSRDSVYYVRAIQEETLAINGSSISERKEFKLCKGSYRTNLNDNCLSPANERAWSSPIYVNKP